MDYLQPLRYHYKPKKGWVNDPNGLVFFDGYYHVFYQHEPDFEVHGKQSPHWGHARTKDFLHWEELPIALYPDHDYDAGGCWSGTATVKDGVLYLFYASVRVGANTQTVSVARSTDGVHFEKSDRNPVIPHFPPDGGPDFRDPAVCLIDGTYYCVMATGNPAAKAGRLLLYESADLLDWRYRGILREWENCVFTECPSFLPAGDGRFLLAASVCPIDGTHYFSLMYGDFADGKFRILHSAEVDRGPDQYAGQIFRDPRGRNLLISWIPGWQYNGFAEKDVGCMSVPREIKLIDGKIVGYPIEEMQHLLTDSDPAVQRTKTGFRVEREGRDPVVYEGELRDLKILRDGYLVEIFVNGGEEVYTVLL